MFDFFDSNFFSKNSALFAVTLGTLFIALFFIFFIGLFIAYFRKLYRMRIEQEKLQAEIANEVNNARNEIQQATLNTISQEIHDNVGQLLSLTKMQLNLIEQSPEKDDNLVREAKDNISKAMTDLRDLAKGMSSDRIKLLGLYDSVLQEAQRINKVGRLEVSVTNNGNKQEPEHQKQLVLFRVIQECFQNIIKHANASSVQVNFSYYPDHFEITITDNGVGFDYSPENAAAEGLGLMNIFNRVQLVGGEANLKSALGQGTTVLISVPL
ncbi:MAG: sensor histidine kinase [Sediminibacterium sp.]|nr:sensor histidine kinase [Sediminibacterium sp.]